MGKSGQVGAQPDRLGGIEPVPEPAAGDQGQLGGDPMRGDQRLSRRDAPFGEGEGQLDFLGPLPAEGFDPGKTGPPQPGDIDGGHAGLRQLRRH